MTTWILLRGLMREARHWGEFPQVFSDKNAGANVVTLDLPGNGRLHRMASPTRVEEMAEYCRREMLARGIRPPYRLLALSLGAMVAVAWAAQHPEEIHACVLINTSLRPFSPFYQRLRPRNYPALLGLALLGGDAERHERLVLGMTSLTADARPDILAAWVAYRRECPVSRRNALRQLIAAAWYRAPARKPVPHMLLLVSAFDQLVDTRCSRHLAAQWQADLAMHPDAGHDIPLDDGAWVATQVRDWVVQWDERNPGSVNSTVSKERRTRDRAVSGFPGSDR